MRLAAWSALGLVIVVALGVGLLFWPARESAQLREVKQLQTEMQQTMFTPPADAKAVPPEERRAQIEQLREKMEALPEKDRKQAEQAMHEGFARQMQEKMKTFFALSPEEQTAALDKDIDEQEARRKAWGAGPFGPPPGPPPNGASKPAPAAGDNVAQAKGPPGNRPFGPPGGWRNQTPEQRKQMQRQMLDSSTPEFRAQMAEYIKKMQARRQARGVPSFGPPT